METKTVSFEVLSWTEDKKDELNIPTDIHFYAIQSIGNMRREGAFHYCSVLKSDNYADWIKYVRSANKDWINLGIIGEYTIITFFNVIFGDNSFIGEKQDILSDINFGKYTILKYDKYKRLKSAYRIVYFDSIYEISANVVTRRGTFGEDEYHSIKCDNFIQYNQLIPQQFDTFERVILVEGKEGDEFWNTLLWQTIKKLNYNELLADKNINYDASYNDRKSFYSKLDELGVDRTNAYFELDGIE